MTLLLREPDVQPQDAPPAPDQPAPDVRACAQCATPLEDGQDWCLSCGAAQPGRLGGRPGMRAAATVITLTLALCGGAVAASYAALQDDAAREAARPAPPSAAPVAQAPPPAPAPPAPADPNAAAPPAADDAPADPPAVDDAPLDPLPGGDAVDDSDLGDLPDVDDGGADLGDDTGTDLGDDANDDAGSDTGSGDADAGDDDAGDEDARADEPAAPEVIALKGDAAETYDPYGRATATTDAARALDGNPDTSWGATVADGAEQMGVGLLVDAGSVRSLRELELTTSTPGFRVEVYATDSADVPPDVLDTRWAHVKDASKVGAAGDGKHRIVLGAGTTKYRYVLLWVTTPPSKGSTVRVSELTVLG